MIAALLLAAAPVATAIDAENAFSRDAKRIGQWTAFRKWADRDAVMFTPQAVWARSFLKPLKDPPKSISWRPAQSFVSCDGRTAVNNGPWFTQDHRQAGYFMTVWQRTPAGWRWVYDGGGVLPTRLASTEPGTRFKDILVGVGTADFQTHLGRNHIIGHPCRLGHPRIDLHQQLQ